jgi:uncharacterized protein (TIGR00369 family)
VSTGALERTASGLEFLERLARGEAANVPIGDTLGFRVTRAERGRVVLNGAPDERSYNLIGTVHGGWAASILDTALALSVLSTLDAEQSFTTIDIRINYLRPITVETGALEAVGRVLQAGRRLAYCEADLTDANGKLLAHGTGSCLIFPRTA